MWIVAHRGASAERPENTLPAFELAIAQGADVIECDVRRTADGHLVVMYDETLDRTTDGTGPLRQRTLDEVRALDAGGGARVPLLEEVLELARGRVRVNVDLKEADLPEDAVATVRRLDMLDGVTFISFLPEVWDEIDRLSPESPVVHLVRSAAALAGMAMGEVGTQSVSAGIGMPYGLVSPEIVENMRRHGYGVFAWTVDDEAEMRRLIDCGVNGIVTNRPAAAVEVVRQVAGAGGARG